MNDSRGLAGGSVWMAIGALEVILVACEPRRPDSDGGMDAAAQRDARADAESGDDAGSDAATDAAADSGTDAASDAGSDAGAFDLQVSLVYETTCDGCAVVEHRIEGRNGDPLPDPPRAEVGIECEIGGTADAPVLGSLAVQDRAIGVVPEQGIQVHDGGIVPGSMMTCGRSDFVLFDSGELTGDCHGLDAGGCQILVNEYDEARGRLVLEIDCDDLVPSLGGTPRHIRHGLLTIQGCRVQVDRL